MAYLVFAFPRYRIGPLAHPVSSSMLMPLSHIAIVLYSTRKARFTFTVRAGDSLLSGAHAGSLLARIEGLRTQANLLPGSRPRVFVSPSMSRAGGHRGVQRPPPSSTLLTVPTDAGVRHLRHSGSNLSICHQRCWTTSIPSRARRRHGASNAGGCQLRGRVLVVL